MKTRRRFLHLGGLISETMPILFLSHADSGAHSTLGHAFLIRSAADRIRTGGSAARAGAKNAAPLAFRSLPHLP